MEQFFLFLQCFHMFLYAHCIETGVQDIFWYLQTHDVVPEQWPKAQGPSVVSWRYFGLWSVGNEFDTWYQARRKLRPPGSKSCANPNLQPSPQPFLALESTSHDLRLFKSSKLLPVALHCWYFRTLCTYNELQLPKRTKCWFQQTGLEKGQPALMVRSTRRASGKRFTLSLLSTQSTVASGSFASGKNIATSRLKITSAAL